MLNKLYEEIKRIIKENYKFFLSLLGIFFVFTIEFPYYIEAPGGIINIEDRIDVSNSYDSEGSLNMAYVSEYKATIPMILVSKINKDWELIKRDTSNANTTTEADYTRNHILLEEANQNAIQVAYKSAGLKIDKKNTKLYVTYVFEEADTDIEVGDELVSINGQGIQDRQDLKDFIQNLSIGETVDIIVRHDNKTYHRSAKPFEYNKSYILGIAVSELSDIEVNPAIEFSFEKSESGSSGGLMMALAIYNAITEDDITGGKKIVGTGTIDYEGNVGEIDGVEYKIQAAVKENADLFLVPAGQNYEEAMKIKKERDYNILIVPVGTFDEALTYLKSN